jgi:membrane-bound lytic murein transglycosylase MltF
MIRLVLLAAWFALAPFAALPGSARGAETETVDMSTEQLKRLNESFTGDLDEMVEDHIIRVLLPYSRTFFFFDGAHPRGISVEFIEKFEKELNEGLGKGALKVQILIIPTARDELIPDLIAGKGDIAAGNLTITKERLTEVDFSDPLATGIEEILVSGPDSEPVDSMFDLAGKEVHARKSSSYYASLLTLNETLRSMGKPEVKIVAADEHLEDEDLLEMVSAGIISYMVIDSHKGELWAQILDNINLHPDVKFRIDGKIGWAIRKDSPQLMAAINEFIKDNKAGTLFGNILIKRYLKETKYIDNSIYREHLQRFQQTIDYFKTYADLYGFPPLMLAALAYQESQIDQSVRSPAGAIGVMQMLPSTAQDKHVGIPDIDRVEPNIHAGTKYLRFLIDRYFADDPNINEIDQILFAFAAYNAGPAKVAQLRKEAAQSGLDPNRWFRNVELIAAKRIGRETVQYVANIFKYYVAYKLLEDKMRTEGIPSITGPKKKVIDS